MNTTKKIVFGLGVASAALLTAWLASGERAQKTKSFIVRRARNLKQFNQPEDEKMAEDSEIHYV